MVGKNAIRMIIMPAVWGVLVGCAASATSVRPPASSEVRFRFDSDRPVAHGAGGVAEASAYLKGHPKAIVVLEGHTDRSGPAVYNDELGDRRARTIKARIIAGGVEERRVVTVSFGERRPKSAEALPAENRRVVITPVGK